MIWVALSAGGVPLRILAESGDADPLALRPGLIITPFDSADEARAHWFDGTAWQPRPALAEPDITPFAGGSLALVWPLPPGTRVEVVDVAARAVLARATIDDGVLELGLIDPGEYRIDIRPPDPWLPISRSLEVPSP